MPFAELTLANWNVGGAKYLQLRTSKKIKEIEDKDRQDENGHEESREEFRNKLNNCLKSIIDIGNYHIITLQEYVEFNEDGGAGKPNSVIIGEMFPKYKIFPKILIDSNRHSHQGKWSTLRKSGEWIGLPFFGQGNAILVHEDILPYLFPVMSIPTLDTTYEEWLDFISKEHKSRGAPNRDLQVLAEHSGILSGAYFGSRDTEPRAASVLHFSLNVGGNLPRDIFVVNTHLTTITHEREGIPKIDRQASNIRLEQIERILFETVSPYNVWRKDKFILRKTDEKRDTTRMETLDRMSPIWIVAGDFNFTPQSAEYRHMIDHNFATMDISHRATKASGLGGSPTITLDYVFVGPLYDAIEPQNLVNYQKNDTVVHTSIRVSDHFPMTTTIPLTSGLT